MSDETAAAAADEIVGPDPDAEHASDGFSLVKRCTVTMNGRCISCYKSVDDCGCYEYWKLFDEVCRREERGNQA